MPYVAQNNEEYPVYQIRFSDPELQVSVGFNGASQSPSPIDSEVTDFANEVAAALGLTVGSISKTTVAATTVNV